MSLIEVLVGLIAACVVLAVVARSVGLPAAVALVFGGMALALLPGVPRVELDPHIVLTLFLPPLLQVSALRTDWKAFRVELRPILLLALGLVLFTAIAIAAVAHALVPDLPWAACVALGAIVAPPDAVAATAVLKTVRIPRRLVTILEGESLLNDASSLILYRSAVTATATATVSFGQSGVSFLVSSVGGAVVGLLVGRVVIVVSRALDDTLLEIAAMVLAGFAAYLGAEFFDLSGVLAAVACGLVVGRRQHTDLSARTRVEAAAVWNFIEFVLTSLVFILIGLQLRDVVGRLGGQGYAHLAGIALAVSGVLIASRFVWVFGSAQASRLLPRRWKAQDAGMPASHLAIVSWAGMRGVVSLAASLALPIGFPGRDLIVFLAFCAILVTLVVQGTTLGWLIRRLGVVEAAVEGNGEAIARRAAADAALAAIERRVFDGRVLGLPDADMLREFRRRAAAARDMEHGTGLALRRQPARLRLELDAVRAARTAMLRHAGQVDGELMQDMIEELDFEEGRLFRALGHGHDPS